MAFAPNSPTLAYCILFSCIIAWGSYAPLRRTSPKVDGPAFGSLAFCAEFTWSCLISFTFGSIGHTHTNSTATATATAATTIVFDSESNFFARLSSDVSSNPGQSSLIMLGGAFVGFGDSICFTVLSYVPSSLAFPLIVGTCIVVGTTISYIVDGSNKPILLFVGVVLLIPSILLLGWAQNSVSKETTDTATETKTETANEMRGIQLGNTVTTTAKEVATPKTKQVATWKWIVLLITIGTINSLWGPLSTLGRRNVSVHSGYFLLTMGRILVQFPSQSVTQMWLYRKPPLNIFSQMYHVPRRDKCSAFGCGVLIGYGYYTYFIGSNVVNKSAAFAISNCSPLWTIVIGVCVQKDLKRYNQRAKIAVALSTGCFIAAVAVLSLSATWFTGCTGMISSKYCSI